jgi:uncharacterized membrane protein YeaQ/YmgE (transglycosylase-associated protein family)
MLYSIIVGGIAGWLAGLIIKGRGSGIILNIILGIVGAFVSNLIFSNLDNQVLGLRPDTLSFDLVTSTIGAIIILIIAGILSR